MRMAHVLMGAMLALVPSILIAQAVETSPRPVLRPVAIEAKFTKASAPFASLRPKIRPQRGQSATTSAVQKVVVEQTINADITARKVTKAEPLRNVVAQTHTGVVTVTSPFAVAKSLRPKKRPRKLRVAMLDTSKPGRVKKAVRYKKKRVGLRDQRVARISCETHFWQRRLRGREPCEVDGSGWREDDARSFDRL